MATLQKIRSKGPLLVIVIGVALLSFIASDAWQIMRPHQSQDVGEVNGEVLSVQEYQEMVSEYTDVLKLSRGLNSLNDEQTNQAHDEVWRSYVSNKLIEKEAKLLGLTVSAAEIQDILTTGTHPMLRQTPFSNPQTGIFDKDILYKFLEEYAKMGDNSSSLSSQYIEQYNMLYKYWSYIQKILIQSRLAEKYQMLVVKSLLSNPIEAQKSFDARVNQYDVLLAAIPYSSVPDSVISLKESDFRELYKEKKEQFRQYEETRDIKYIDVHVTASSQDKAAIQQEVDEATAQLNVTTDDYASFVRSVGSEIPYVDLFYNKSAFPNDVTVRLDSVAVGAVFGPYYYATDNTINSFKVIDKASAADSIEFCQIQVYTGDFDKTQTLADSIYTAIKEGASFEDVANIYGQTGTPNWMTASQYEGMQIDGDNLKFISAVNNAKVNELINVPIGQTNIILQVTNKKAMKDKYKVAVIKREVEFSKETYNSIYNDFSQFIAANSTVEKMEENAEEAGYKVLDKFELSSSEHGIGNVKGTKEALRWIFEKASPGEVSGLYECGENDHLLVAGLVNVRKEGYRSLKSVQEQLRMEITKNKKAEKIMADIETAKPTTFEQYLAMPNVVSDSLTMVTFSAPAYVASMRSSEPLVGAYASVAEMNKLSDPMKGNAGVFVVQKNAMDKLDETFDSAEEQMALINVYVRFSNRMMNDLFLKGKVKDNRYLFF